MLSKEQEEARYQKFMQEEILDKKNLVPADFSDYWLDVFTDEFSEGGGLNSLAATLLIIAYQKQTNEITLSEEEYTEYCEFFRLEVSVETLNRCGKISCKPATKDNIFDKNRVMNYIHLNR